MADKTHEVFAVLWEMWTVLMLRNQLVYKHRHESWQPQKKKEKWNRRIC